MTEKIRIDSSDLAATIGDVRYRWFGGFGAVIQSREKGVKENDIRMIGNVIFFAYTVRGRFRTKLISWIPQQEISAEWIREFRRAVFCHE